MYLDKTRQPTQAPLSIARRRASRLGRASLLSLAVALAPSIAHAQAAAPASGTAQTTPPSSSDTGAASAATAVGVGPKATAPAQTTSGAAGVPANGDDSASRANQLGDVVVTARRVSERLQDIPGSVASIGDAQIARSSSLDDLSSAVSGLTFKSFGPIPAVGIRGFGNRANTQGPNNTIGIFQDGVFIAPFLSALTSRDDVERVEVAKGPQSTLYGRSTYAGAINIVTNDPTNTFSGYLDGGVGGSSSHGELLWHTRGVLSGPLTDTLSARIFVDHEQRDGFTYDPVSGNRGYGYDRTLGRIKIVWKPTDKLKVTLAGSLMHDNAPRGDVSSGTLIPPLGQQALSGIPYPVPGNVATYLRGPDIWRTTLTRPQIGKVNGQQGTMDIRYETGIGELAFLTDYTHSDTNILSTADASIRNVADIFTITDEQRFSQEVRLSGKSNGFSYIGGLYFLHTDFKFGDPGATIDTNAPFIRVYPGSTLYNLAGIQAIYTPFDTKTTAYAAFAQVGYDITDRLNLTGGLRQSRDELSGYTLGAAQLISGPVIVTVPRTDLKHNFNATTGTANLSYKLAPDALVYASYSRGNSPGGFNSGGAATIQYVPQNVNAYEVGLKSELLDKRIRLNLALFDNEYSNLQFFQAVSINNVNTQVTLNAAKARGRGIDLDTSAVLTSDFRLGVQYTYQGSKITAYNIPAAPAPQVTFVGVPLVRSPRESVNGYVTYNHDFDGRRFQLTAEESYTSSYVNDYTGVPAGTRYGGPAGGAPGVTTTQVLALFRTPGFAITNLNASISEGKWELSAYVRNLFNHQYIVLASGTDPLSFPTEAPGEPRTFEFSVKRSF
ncbi:TonB-dependent receptor [uncultured Sphingomonas sp.]|uniref:TonB-dependent receptor n=1 Tax=uncultured Sphingomonas sp. TaxID=158754 RepID=UPI0035CA4DAC